MKKQLGVSLIGLFIVIIFLGIVGIYGSQIGLGYLDKNVLQGAIKNVLIEEKNNDNTNTVTIKNSILRKISTNNIDIESKDIIVTKESFGFNVKINYMKDIKINNNISVILSFDINEDTPN